MALPLNEKKSLYYYINDSNILVSLPVNQPTAQRIQIIDTNTASLKSEYQSPNSLTKGTSYSCFDVFVSKKDLTLSKKDGKKRKKSGYIELWQLSTGELLKTSFLEEKNQISAIKFANGGKQFFIGTITGTLALYTIATDSFEYIYKRDSSSRTSFNIDFISYLSVINDSSLAISSTSVSVLDIFTKSFSSIGNVIGNVTSLASIDSLVGYSVRGDTNMIFLIDLEKKESSLKTRKKTILPFKYRLVSQPLDSKIEDIQLRKMANTYHLLATTSNGSIYLYNVPQDAPSSSTNRDIPKSQDFLIRGDGIRWATFIEEKIFIYRSEGVGYQFDKVDIPDFGNSISEIKLDTLSPSVFITPDGKKPSKKKKLPVSVLDRGEVLVQNKQFQRQPQAIHEPTIGEIIDIENKISFIPRVEGIVTILEQAIDSSDTTRIEYCLGAEDIDMTITKLHSEYLIPLLNILINRLGKRPRSERLLKWIHTIIIKKTPYLVEEPKILELFAQLYNLLEPRVAIFPNLLKLQGRLELLIAHSTKMEERDTLSVFNENGTIIPEEDYKEDNTEINIE